MNGSSVGHCGGVETEGNKKWCVAMGKGKKCDMFWSVKERGSEGKGFCVRDFGIGKTSRCTNREQWRNGYTVVGDRQLLCHEDWRMASSALTIFLMNTRIIENLHKPGTVRLSWRNLFHGTNCCHVCSFFFAFRYGFAINRPWRGSRGYSLPSNTKIGFDPCPVHLAFFAGKRALGQVFIRIHSPFPIRTTPPVLLNHFPFTDGCNVTNDLLTYLLIYLLTYSMEQSPSWEANQ